MNPNTKALTTALRILAGSIEADTDSDLVKATILAAAERLEKLEQERDELKKQARDYRALWLES